MGEPFPPTDPTPAPAMSRLRLGLLFAVPVVLLAAAWGGGVAAYNRMHSAPPVTEAATPPAPDGHKLFARNCAYCHGESGDGRGVAGLTPPARYFGKEAFRFASTTNGIPTDDDLFRVIHQGIPGSAMPSFDHLTDAERAAIAGHVRGLVAAGIYERLREKQKDDFFPDEGWKTAVTLAQPGKALEVPVSHRPATAESLERGKAIFLKSCANCHGKEGCGDGEQTKDPKFICDNGCRAVPRDLTAGIFKGGRERERIYTRIVLGIPGTPMPATNTLKPEELDDLVNYVLSLSEGKAVPAARPGAHAVVRQ